MGPSSSSALARAIEYENRLVERTFTTRQTFTMIQRYHDGEETRSILSDLDVKRFKAIEQVMVTASLTSRIVATLPNVNQNHPDASKQLISREQQIQKIIEIYPSYGEAKVREDFSLIDAYNAGATIEELSQSYKRTFDNILTTGLLIAKHCSDFAINKAHPISEAEQVGIIAIVNFGRSQKSLSDALYEHREFEKDGKKARAEMIWRDLGVRVSPSDLP